MTTFVAGAAAGGLLTAVWMISATDIEVLAERVAFRTGTDVSTAVEKRNFSFGEFLSRQWEFAGHELMAPLWLRVLLFPALLAGLADRRTRIPVAITLTIAATLTFTFMQGAWIHRLWNFPWLAPATIGLAALFDAVRRALRGSLARLRSPLGAFCAVGTVATLFLVVTGGTREFYLTGPADAGAVLQEAAERGVETDWVWTTPGISTARWVSYYLDAPVWGLDEELFDDLRDTDLVLVRNDRVPDYLPPGALDEPLAAGSSYTLVSAEALRR